MKYEFTESSWDKNENGYELSILKEESNAHYIVQVYEKEGNVESEIIIDIYNEFDIVRLEINTPFAGYALLIKV